MSDAVPATPAPAGFAQQMSTRAAFFSAGFSVSAWAPLVPYAKARLALSDAHLGLLLLCLGLGSVTVMPLSGTLAARFGCRRVMVLATLAAAVALPVLATANHVLLLAAALLLFGAGVGTLDVTMNIQAVLVERASGRAMMSGFHGLYSLGGICGAGCVTLLTAAGASPLVAVIAVLAVVLLLLMSAAPYFLPVGGERGAPAFVLPHGRVILIGLFCFVLFLAEGSVLDWSAVFLTTVRHFAETHAGLGYVAFSCAMTLCRLGGDPVVQALGRRNIVRAGGLCAAAGFGLAVFVPNPVTAVIGFALVGVGASNVVPTLFSAAGDQTAMPTHLAIAAIGILGYAGILSGPALVGFVASLATLSGGLLFVAVLLIAVALNAPLVHARRRPAESA